MFPSVEHRPDLPEQLLPDVQAGVDFYARDFLPGIPVANVGLCRVDLEKIRLPFPSFAKLQAMRGFGSRFGFLPASFSVIVLNHCIAATHAPTSLNRRRGQSPVVGAHTTPPTSSFLANFRSADKPPGNHLGLRPRSHMDYCDDL
jgi:hypothetical protein